MQAISGVKASLGATELTQLRPTLRVYRRNDLLGHAGGACALDYRDAIGIEFGRIQMTVSVYQHKEGKVRAAIGQAGR